MSKTKMPSFVNGCWVRYHQNNDSMKISREIYTGIPLSEQCLKLAIYNIMIL